MSALVDFVHTDQREFCGFLERAMGIEPTSEAWEARNKNLKALELAAFNSFGEGLSWKIDGK
jgi:hypothetical protein